MGREYKIRRKNGEWAKCFLDHEARRLGDYTGKRFSKEHIFKTKEEPHQASETWEVDDESCHCFIEDGDDVIMTPVIGD